MMVAFSCSLLSPATSCSSCESVQKHVSVKQSIRLILAVCLCSKQGGRAACGASCGAG